MSKEAVLCISQDIEFCPEIPTVSPLCVIKFQYILSKAYKSVLKNWNAKNWSYWYL